MIYREISRDGRARVGILQLNGIEIETPVFMPVGTRGTIKSMSSEDIDSLGYDLILANTYHLYLRPGVDVMNQFGGLKNYMSYNRSLLTDSGGFQVFSLKGLFRFEEDGVKFQSHIDGSWHKFSPQKVVDIQRSIGSDIIMVLDDCPAYGSDANRLNASLQRTHHWLDMSVRYWQENKNKQHMFGIVQGGTDESLRKQSLDYIQSSDVDGIALGGLSVGEPRDEFERIITAMAPHLDNARPRYLMGVGTVVDILESVKNGIDMFDCVLPTRNARNGQVFTSYGKVNLRNEKHRFSDSPIDPLCGCRVCKRYSLGYIRHLHTVGELLGYSLSTYHNLYFMKEFMKNLRTSILQQDFANYYEKWKNLYT